MRVVPTTDRFLGVTFSEDLPRVRAEIAGMIQGATLVPYLREGRRADGRNLQFFASLVQGDSALYMVMLN